MLNKIVFTSKIFARIFKLYIGFLNAAVNLYHLYLDIFQVEKNSFSNIFVMFLRVIE